MSNYKIETERKWKYLTIDYEFNSLQNGFLIYFVICTKKYDQRLLSSLLDEATT